MKSEVERILNDLMERLPQLAGCREPIIKAYEMIQQCYRNRGKLMVCGNGGSAADAEHIIGELMKGFLSKRVLPEADRVILREAFPEEGQYLADHLQGALPAISLVSQTSLSTAFSNDVAPDMIFAQQVYGYGQPGDVVIGLSTSGNSKNVVNALKVAKAFGLATVGMTGANGGLMKEICDVTIAVPATGTPQIQELHLPVYHGLCAMIEAEFFN